MSSFQSLDQQKLRQSKRTKKSIALRASLVLLGMAFGSLACATDVGDGQDPESVSKMTVLYAPESNGYEAEDTLALEAFIVGANQIKIKDKGDEVGTVVGVNIADGIWSPNSLDEDNDFYDVGIEIGSSDSIGLRMDGEGASAHFFGNLKVQAQIALQGNGRISLTNTYYADSEDFKEMTAQIQGAIDMAQGTIYNAGYKLDYSGEGHVGTLISADTESVLSMTDSENGRTTSALLVHEFVAAGGIVNLSGKVADNVAISTSSLLTIKSMTNEHSMIGGADVSTTTFNVTGDATLALGTDFSEFSTEVGQLLPNFDSLSKVQQTLAVANRILASTDLVSNNPNSATLILSSGFALPDNVDIRVGTVIGESTSGITIGNDGRIIYLANSIMASSAAVAVDGQGSRPKLTVMGEGKAQFILYGWDGKTPIDVAFDEGFNAANFIALGGVRAQLDAAGNILRLWCHEFAGLQSSEMVKFVEERTDNANDKVLPGYAFIVDSFTEERVGKDIYANTLDAAVFMPVTDGLAAAFERAQTSAVDKIMAHDIALFEGENHWWATGWYEDREMPELFKGGNGAWGINADVATGVLGYDFGLAQNWIGTFAVYAGSIDTESTGLVQATTGDMSFGGAHISATYLDQDSGEFRFGLSFARGEGDSKQTVNAHRLTTEPTINMATASVRWQADWSSDVWHFKPVAQLGVHWAQLKRADIRDESENASGVGFKTESATRVWSDVTVGGDIESRLKFYEFDVVPRFGMSLTKAFGQTDWKVTSQLFDGKAQSTASFESARDFSARLSAGLTIASSGFAPEMTGGIFGYGAKPTGKSLPYAWILTIDGAHEWASDSEEASYVGLSFKQLY